jgi:hypothetical protein
MIGANTRDNLIGSDIIPGLIKKLNSFRRKEAEDGFAFNTGDRDEAELAGVGGAGAIVPHEENILFRNKYFLAFSHESILPNICRSRDI